MRDEKDDSEGADSPWIRLALYIIFTIGGAVVGGIAAILLLNRTSWRNHGLTYQAYPYEYPIEFIVGAIVGAVSGFIAVRRACRDVDSEK